jgi:hypothetical protein
MRIIKTIGIVVGMYATALLAEVFVAGMKTDYQGGVTLLVILGFLAYLSPKVGYRGLDCFFALIPIYGFIYVVKIAYRIAFLPQRDWSERKG